MSKVNWIAGRRDKERTPTSSNGSGICSALRYRVVDHYMNKKRLRSLSTTLVCDVCARKKRCQQSCFDIILSSVHPRTQSFIAALQHLFFARSTIATSTSLIASVFPGIRKIFPYLLSGEYEVRRRRRQDAEPRVVGHDKLSKASQLPRIGSESALQRNTMRRSEANARSGGCHN